MNIFSTLWAKIIAVLVLALLVGGVGYRVIQTKKNQSGLEEVNFNDTAHQQSDTQKVLESYLNENKDLAEYVKTLKNPAKIEYKGRLVCEENDKYYLLNADLYQYTATNLYSIIYNLKTGKVKSIDAYSTFEKNGYAVIDIKPYQFTCQTLMANVEQ